MDKIVSVVVTSHNHEAYIAQCLNSIFEQTYRELELIIIDDGSTDDSKQVIEQTISQAPCSVTFISQENMGVCFARNKGIESASGEYLLFVDSDDYLDKDFIEKLVACAEHNAADIVYCDLYDPQSKSVYVQGKPFEFDSYITGNYISNCSLIKRSIIGTNRYDIDLNRKFLEDYDFFMGLIVEKQAAPVYCSETKVNYRILEDSISRKDGHSAERYYYEVYLGIIKKYLDPKRPEMYPAIENNVFRLEDRLTELIDHLGDVTQYVHSLEAEKAAFQKQLNESEQNLDVVKSQKAALGRELEDAKIISQELEKQKNQILGSLSFRLGNTAVRPAKFAVKALRNPKLIRPALGRGKRAVLRRMSPILPPQKFLLKPVRGAARKRNNYVDPSRVLVYVIYSNGSAVQEYKIIFLEALAKISKRVLIVVNGQLLPDDQERLAQYGEVVCRSNEGYDTAAFRHGILHLGKEILNQYDELLLVNDTNVGPFGDLTEVFHKMAQKQVDFWGISYGEPQPDFTGYNKYKRIPVHLQSFFLVIEKSLLAYDGFYKYWEALDDTNSRDKAIGKHETVFTLHFENLGFKHSAVTADNHDSAIYFRPLTMLKAGIPLVKYTAFANYDSDQFAWQGLIRESEIPELLEYIKTETDYPYPIIEGIMDEVKNRQFEEHILIIDGVENALPQLTKYRVDNKVEQLESLGFKVWKVNASGFQMGHAAHASHIIIYRAPFTDQLGYLCQLAKKYNKPVLFDIDDLVIDTKYTDQLTYTQEISAGEKEKYDAGVNSYGAMMRLCDGAVTTTKKLQEELANYQDQVLINRNLASKELVEISQQNLHQHHPDPEKVSIGYFSGSITHNENFQLVLPAIQQIMAEFPNVEFHVVGYLDLPEELKAYKERIVTHDFVEWRELPALISEVDINIAPLVTSVFNEAKSEIKWIEASLVKVPTIASDLGAFKEMVQADETGLLVKDDEWYDGLKRLVSDGGLRGAIADRAYDFVLENCVTEGHEDELSSFLRGL